MINDQMHKNFIDLVSFDQKVHAVEEELRLLRNSLSELDEQKLLLNKTLDEMKLHVYDLKKHVDSQELLMKSLDYQESEKKNRLESISSQKEYSAIKSEITKINEQQREAENELISAWDALELAQKKLNSHEVVVRNKLDEFVQIKTTIEQKIEATLLTLDDLYTQRKVFRAAVPEELLDNYEHMRGLVSNAVVPVIQGSCSACFYAVPAQDLGALKRGKLLPCKSCYRILFLDELSD
jgi:uncharacterized protein